MVGNGSTLNDYSLQPGNISLRKAIEYKGHKFHEPSGNENNLFQGLQLNGNKRTNSASFGYPLSRELTRSKRNVINGSRPPTRQSPRSVSVKIDGLYSPTKLIHKEFRTNRDLHPLKQESHDVFGGVKIHQKLQSKDANIIVVEPGGCGAIRLIKTLTRNSQIETSSKFCLAFKKNITSSGASFTMNVWHMQGLIEHRENLKTCLRFVRSVIVLVYDVTEVDCVYTLSRLIPVMMGIVRFKIPIILVANTSDMTCPFIVKGSEKRERSLPPEYAVYLKNRYGFSDYYECSIESVAEVDKLFLDILNGILSR